MSKSDLESTFIWQLEAARLPEPKHEYIFCPPRKWRFDFAWLPIKLAVEIEGGTYSNGRHTRPVGFENDCEKYNAAALLGWRVLRFTGHMVEDGRALAEVEKALQQSAPLLEGK